MLDSKSHRKCFHVGLRAGVVYCLDHRTVYVNSDTVLDADSVKKESWTHEVGFMAACREARKSLPPGVIDCYVWVHPTKGQFMRQPTTHTVQDLIQEMVRRKTT